ncbi:hypothetical protein CICLE_v10024552mg, partial [Citrus x clementina]
MGGPNIPAYTLEKLQSTKILIILDDGSEKDEHVHEVKRLNHGEELQLFYKYAFRQNHCPQDDLNVLSKKVVRYTEGDPLALEVLDWENVLDNLKQISNVNRIYKVLRISYEQLNSEEKSLFLDIACFSKGECKDRVATLLHDRHYNVTHGLRILVDKSLITISEHINTMPDPLKTPNLEKINLWNCTNLVRVPSSIQNFNHLNMLCFEGCKILRSFPSNLHFVSPVTIDFTSCINLTDFPHISGNITRLYLDETAIEEVPPSIKCLTNLKLLRINRCTRLKRVSTSICKLKSLIALSAYGCLNLERFPESLEKMEHLNQINLGRTTITEQRPSSFENVKGLETLGNNFEGLPASIKQLSRLEFLDLSNCNSLQSLPELPLRLKRLNASDCERLQSCQRFHHLYTRSFEEENVISSIQFWFNNCSKLDAESNNKNLADSQLRIQHMAIASFRLFYELEDEERCARRGPTIILPGSKIPEWFSNQSSGSEITLQLPQHCCQNLIGFAICAVL